MHDGFVVQEAVVKHTEPILAPDEEAAEKNETGVGSTIQPLRRGVDDIEEHIAEAASAVHVLEAE